MALLDALRAFFSPMPGTEPPYYPIDEVVQERGLTSEAMWGSGWSAMASTAGTPTDIENALKSIAVQAAIRLLVNDIGSLPVDAFRRVDGQQRKELTLPSWVSTPNPLNPNETWEDHAKEVVFSLLSDGNGFVRCHPNVFQVEGLEALDPTSVEVKPFRQSMVYSVKGEGDLSPAEIIHIPWVKRPGKARGLNPIEAAKEGIGIALATDQFVGSYFGNGATLGGVLKYPAGVSLTDAQLKDILTDFNKAHQGAKKAHAIGALTDGGEIVYPDYNNREAQLLELREHVVEEVARLFGIPPHMLGSQKPGAVGYASVEQRSIDYVTHAVLPITRRLGTGYSRLLRGQRTYLKFNVRGLLAGDAAARSAYYTALLQNKVIKREEVRSLEDLEWDGDLGYLETPNNNAPEEPAPAPEPTRAIEPVINLTFPDHFDIPAPVVNVAPPEVNVAPTVVNVAAPIVEGLEPLAAAIVELRDNLGNLPAPIVNVAPPLVTVQVPPQKPTRKRIVRDAEDRIVDVIEELVDD